MRVPTVIALALTACMLGSAVVSQEPPSGAGDDEIQAHLQILKQRIEDPGVDLSTKERLAMEAAAMLDRAAQASPSADVRRKRWTDAVALLDGFREAHPGEPLSRQFEVQAAVYLWARARSWVDPAKVVLASQSARDKALEDLGASALRLRSTVSSLGGAGDVFTQNARFRLAQAVADLAEVGPSDPATRKARNTEALEALARPLTEPSLQGYVRLLRGTVLARLGRFTEAKAEVDAAAASKPPPPERDVLDARVAALSGMKQFAQALKAIDASRLDNPSKLALRVRVDLDDLRSRPAGPERDAAQSALFRDLNALRASRHPESRLGLVLSATAVREPAASQGPEAWDLIADGALAMGDPARAGTLETRGADRAEAVGNGQLAAELRLKAGAAKFQAGKFAEADPLLTRVAEDPKAGAFRPRAALLRSLSRGRWLAEGTSGASSAAYTSALRYQIETFPNESSTAEARWLLGRLRLAESDRKGALELWESIPHGAPRWLETRIEIARTHIEDLEALRISNDPEAVARRLEEARTFLKKCQGQAEGEVETNALRIARARLELTPGAGLAEVARQAAESVLRSVARPEEREEARGLLLIALAQLSRFVEAEQVARQEAGSRDSDPNARLDILRTLDRTATGAESDLKMRRMGLLMNILARPLTENAQSLSADRRAELKLREIRGLVFSGDDLGARRAVSGWVTSTFSNNPDLLRDLADTYIRLDAYALAADVQRLRTKNLPSGSPAWFDARYGLALAYYRSGKPTEALALIDATSILHPDLGGGELRNRFIRLRQRIEPNQ
jgi:tetratricopeptide (TPR) repeat protein